MAVKQILLACGSGICTSTAVRQKVEKLLDDNGFKGMYNVTQCKVAEAPAKSPNFDFLIATTMEPQNLKCPYVNGVPFLTGVATQASEAEILRLMKE
jgi:PTS system galactitol-specific IIB component